MHNLIIIRAYQHSAEKGNRVIRQNKNKDGLNNKIDIGTDALGSYTEFYLTSEWRNNLYGVTSFLDII